MNIEPKPVKERDTLNLLELVCQLHSRALNQPRNKNMHDAYVEARQEMERRIKVNNNFVLADVGNRVFCQCKVSRSPHIHYEENGLTCSECKMPIKNMCGCSK